MTIPTITEADVRRYADPQSFQRGTDYYHRGTILNPTCQGNELHAECQGSEHQPYRVSVTLGEHGIADYTCSCPRGGFCKHIVALLLTWIHAPEQFDVLPPLEESLARRSREELIVLVKEMIARQPDLARLLELPLGPADEHPFDPEPFRRQLRYALTRDEVEWVVRELEQIRHTADSYLEAGDPIVAGHLYALILKETLNQMQDWWLEWDRDGDIFSVLQGCAEGLEQCLEAGTADEETRRPWLEALLEAELKDIRLGGVDLATPAGDVLLEQATAEEWAWIEVRLQQELSRADKWTRGALVSFMTRRRELSGDRAEADAFLLEHGTPEQRAFRLVALGGVEEALRIAEQHFTDLPGLVIRFADVLVRAGHGEAAVAYMTAQMGNKRHAWHYRPWLARYFQERGDQQVAVDLWRQDFENEPSLETYHTLREMGTDLGIWENLRPALLSTLGASHHGALLIDIALEEGNVAWGLEIARRPDANLNETYWERLAQAAETERPRDALDIYCWLAEWAIALRGRENYRRVAEYLRRISHLYRKMGETAAWEDYITHLRQEHSRLPALQDELRKAGLIS